MPHMTLLTLLTLLAGLSCARTASVPAAVLEEDARCGDQPRPTITATALSSKSHRILNWSLLSTVHGEDITLFCSSSDANVTIRDDERQLQAHRLNSSTIQLSVIKPDTGEYSYYCVDSITNCTGVLFVDIAPAMSVTAPHVYKYADTSYFVTRGEAFNIFCSAQTLDLSIDVYGHELQTKAVNATTVMATVTNHTEGSRVYLCGSPNSPRASIGVMVDNYPEAREFRCVLSQPHKLECSWKSSSTKNTFRLFMLHDSILPSDSLRDSSTVYQKRTFVCLDRWAASTAGCTGTLDDELIFLSTISLQLETCNIGFCSNQTFIMNKNSIAKQDPVYGLKALKSTPQGATISWRHSVRNCVYKVEYRLFGTDWRPVNASKVQCEEYVELYEYGEACQLELPLPCPDAHYELRVSARLKNVTEDSPWSDTTSTYFFTARSPADVVNPVCVAALEEPEPITSVESASSELGKLIRESIKKKSVVNDILIGLKRKLAEINKLRA